MQEEKERVAVKEQERLFAGEFFQCRVSYTRVYSATRLIERDFFYPTIEYICGQTEKKRVFSLIFFCLTGEKMVYNSDE
jgi:hypothetical protein